MGDTADGSWNSSQLGGFIRREQAEKERNAKARGAWYASPYVWDSLKWGVYSPSGVCVGVFPSKREALRELEARTTKGVTHVKAPFQIKQKTPGVWGLHALQFGGLEWCGNFILDGIGRIVGFGAFMLEFRFNPANRSQYIRAEGRAKL